MVGALREKLTTESPNPNEPEKGKMKKKDLWPLALLVLILIIGASIPPLTPPAMSKQKGDVNLFIFFMVVCPFMVALILFYYMRIREMKQDLKERQRQSQGFNCTTSLVYGSAHSPHEGD